MVKKTEEKNQTTARDIIVEIETIMAERNEKKSTEMWQKLDTNKIISYIDLKIFEVEILCAKIKMANFILKGRIFLPKND